MNEQDEQLVAAPPNDTSWLFTPNALERVGPSDPLTVPHTIDLGSPEAAVMTHRPAEPIPPAVRAHQAVAQSIWDTLMVGPKLMADVASGQTDPNSPEAIRRATDAAMTVAGGGMFGAERNALGTGIRAYHGSPHDFNQFDIPKIGTGEGAQTYGHGLYFAENPKVAEEYKDVRKKIAAWTSTNDEWKDLPSGKMYHVDINAEPGHFLDWDKPLSEQSEHIRNRLMDSDIAYHAERQFGSAWKQRLSGARLIKEVVGDASSGSQSLRNAGIPGIKYLDQGSRKAIELQKIIDQSISPDRVRLAKEELAKLNITHNYVVFDDKLIDIMKKYGLAGLAALPATGAHHFRTVPVEGDPFAESSQ